MEAVLVVDDDPNVLAAHRRTLRQFNVTYALNGYEALDRMRDTSYAVCVVDMRMPGMAGDSLLARIRETYPDTIRIVLTGDGDIRTAVAAVNDGHIFRFLAKPCPAPAVAKAVSDGIQQYRLMRGERDLLEKTLAGVVRVLTEVLSAINPVAFTYTLRIRENVQRVTTRLRLADAWQYDMAAMLSQLGCIGLPPELLSAVYGGGELSDADRQRYEVHAAFAHELLSNIPRLEAVAWMIARQHEPIDATRAAQPVTMRDPAEIGGAILHAATEMERLVAGGLSEGDAIADLRTRPKEFDAAILTALGRATDTLPRTTTARVAIADLTLGMTVANSVRTLTGLMLARQDQEITPPLLARLQNFARVGSIPSEIEIMNTKTAPPALGVAS
jgi:FixJ family two-component response regulator